MTAPDLYQDDADRIEREIAATRASLQRKLEELQHRLNPRERMRAAMHAIDPRPYARPYTARAAAAARTMDDRAYAGFAALAAIGVGTALAVRGLRRGNGDGSIGPMATDMMGE